MTQTAARVLLSYPADLSDWGRRIVEDEPFRAYLRRVHAVAEEGDVWPEFVGTGCCGDSLDVPLRVEEVEGGSALGEGTVLAFEARAECTGGGGWSVQSGAGP